MNSAFAAADSLESGTEAYEDGCDDGWLSAIDTIILDPSSTQTMTSYGQSVTIIAKAKTTRSASGRSEIARVTVTSLDAPTVKYGVYQSATFQENAWNYSTANPKGVTYAYMFDAGNHEVGTRKTVDGSDPFKHGWDGALATVGIVSTSSATLGYNGSTTVKVQAKANYEDSDATDMSGKSITVTSPKLPELRWGYYSGSTWKNQTWDYTNTSYPKGYTKAWMRNNNADVGTALVISGSDPFQRGYDSGEVVGANGVTMSWGWAEATGSSNATLNQGFKVTLSNGTAETKYVKITGGNSFAVSNHQSALYVRITDSAYSSNSTIIMKKVIDASEVYEQGLTDGAASVPSVTWPTASDISVDQIQHYSGYIGSSDPSGNKSTELSTFTTTIRNNHQGTIFFRVNVGSVNGGTIRKWYRFNNPTN